ncbi:MAG: hypothetical protein VCA36_11640, partial [Opitutales bacterium]
MSTVDQFESVFKAAAKSIYVHEESTIRKVLVATDLEGAEANYFLQATKTFVGQVVPGGDWHLLEGKDYAGARGLLEQVETIHPDLTVTYRHLGSESWRWPYGLGECLDVLTQVTPNPILVLPHPERKKTTDALSHAPRNVMAVSSHLGTDNKLIGHAIHFTASNGKLKLSHLEDETTFERYLGAIAKIPDIDTEV